MANPAVEENIYARVYKNGHKTYLNAEADFMKRTYVSFTEYTIY
jgi:hypothetical protein